MKIVLKLSKSKLFISRMMMAFLVICCQHLSVSAQNGYSQTNINLNSIFQKNSDKDISFKRNLYDYAKSLNLNHEGYTSVYYYSLGKSLTKYIFDNYYDKKKKNSYVKKDIQEIHVVEGREFTIFYYDNYSMDRLIENAKRFGFIHTTDSKYTFNKIEMTIGRSSGNEPYVSFKLID